ncbi:MAG: acyltransferase [Deltaproteobacteria bacterium]|nr:acyltransferase [Deltaproteobacteria bacterium]
MITLGRAVNISSYCRIATFSGIEIGESTLIAAYCYIGCANHSLDDTTSPMIEQPVSGSRGVKIGEHAWIGTHAVILDGVSIGAHAVVGAHALVREDVPPYAVVAGIPARIIRQRG